MKTRIVMNKFFATVLAVITLASTAVSQTTEYTKNTADQALRSTGRVNPSSLGLEVDIPLGSYPGRGISVPIGLSYSSKVWRLEEHQSVLLNNNTTNVYVDARYSENAAAGWTSSFSQPYIEYTDEINRFDSDGKVRPEVMSPGSYDPGGDLYVKRITVYLPGGESHELRAGDAPVSTVNGVISEDAWNGTYYSVDGSGIKYIQDNTTNPATYKLLMPDGSRFDFSTTREAKYSTTPGIQVRRATQMSDVNGNYITFHAPTSGYLNGSISDQLGRTFPIMVPRENPSLGPSEQVLEQRFVLPGMNPDTPYVLRWKRLKGDSPANSALSEYSTALHYTGHTNNNESATYSPSLFGTIESMGCSSNHLRVLGYDLFNPVVLAEVILPNAAVYEFKYNEYGEIDKIHYPSGGREEIKYQKVASLAQLSKPYLIANRGVEKREIFESEGDSLADTWTYSAASSDNQFRTSVVAPDGTQTDRFMHRGLPEPSCSTQSIPAARDNVYGRKWGYDNVLAGMPFEERVFSSSDQIVKRTLTRWTATNTSTMMTGVPLRYAQINARTETTESIVYDGDAGLSSATALEYDTDQGDPGSPLNVLQTTDYGYKPVSGGSSFSPATPLTVPDAAVPTIADPTQGATAARITEITYLQSDPNYASTKANYLAKNLVKLPTKTVIKNGAGTTTVSQSEIKYDEPDLGNGYRGEVTSLRNWLDTTSSWLETKTKYDTYGNAVEVTDAKGNTTTTAYDLTYHAFPVELTSPIPSDGTHGSNVAFTTVTTYDMVTGQPRTVTDSNGVQTRMEYNDPMLRPTRVAAYHGSGPQVGSATETSYGVGTSSTTRWIKTRSQIDGTNWKESTVSYDGLARTIKSETADSDGDIIVETQYDNMSRPYKVSNPYRRQTVYPFGAAEPIYWTESVLDAAGRPWKVTTADGAVVETTYGVATSGGNIGTTVTVKDQAGKLRRSITNAFGHLTRVDEPSSAGELGAVDAPNQPTFYSYDLLNNLTQVQQPGDNNEECGASATTCSQTRSFQYDSLSRLKQATNPESGTIQYGYDANSNLTTKTDARGITTTFGYDALNRVKTRTYTNEPSGSETPDVAYYYDLVANANGKLIKVTNGSGADRSTTEYTAFDILGRVTAHKQTTDNNEYVTSYTYNLAGALIEQQYPSGRVVKNVLDSDGELATVQSRKNANHAFWNFANHFSYSAAGAVTSMQLGNGRWESTQFNERLQPTQIALGKIAPSLDAQGQLVYSSELLKLNYEYGELYPGTGNTDFTKNNGNISKQTITVQAVGATPGFVATQYYAYDSLNRIEVATENVLPDGQPLELGWRQHFKFDRNGNRNFVTDGSTPTTTLGTCPTEVCNPSISPNTNKITSAGYLFDNAGNTTRDAQDRKFTFDAENKQTKVESLSPGTQTVTGTVGEYWFDGDGKRVKTRAFENNVPTEETIFVYDAAGKLIGEYSNQVASSQDAKVAYLTNDKLGSPRINTDINGNGTARHDYHPFGEEIAGSKRTPNLGYGDDSVRKQFTGYESDGETDLEYAQARMYMAPTGRFTTGDPLLSTGTLDDPQTWNRYPFSLNKPTVHTDPTGLYVCKNLSAKECETFENARLKAEKNLAKIAEKYKNKGGTESKEYKKAEKALLAFGKQGVDNGVYIRKGGSDDGAVTPGASVAKTKDNPLGQSINVTFKSDSFDSTKVTNLDALVIHEGSHVADVSDWFRGGRVENERFSSYNSEFEAYTVTSLYAEATGMSAVIYDVNAPEPYTRFIFPATIWDQSWSDVDKETLRSNGIDRLLRWDKQYLGGKPDKQILPNVRKK